MPTEQAVSRSYSSSWSTEKQGKDKVKHQRPTPTTLGWNRNQYTLGINTTGLFPPVTWLGKWGGE